MRSDWMMRCFAWYYANTRSCFAKCCLRLQCMSRAGRISARNVTWQQMWGISDFWEIEREDKAVTETTRFLHTRRLLFTGPIYHKFRRTSVFHCILCSILISNKRQAPERSAVQIKVVYEHWSESRYLRAVDTNRTKAVTWALASEYTRLWHRFNLSSDREIVIRSGSFRRINAGITINADVSRFFFQ